MMYSDFSVVEKGIIEILLMAMIYVSVYLSIVSFTYRISYIHRVLNLFLLTLETLMLLFMLDYDYMKLFGRSGNPFAERLQNLPVVVIILALFIILAFKFATTLKIIEWKKSYITKFSLKEGADKMPLGICFYDYTGRLVLTNEMMYRLGMEITGESILNGEEFWEDINGAVIGGSSVRTEIPDNIIIKLDSGQVWSFIRERLKDVKEETWQITASDITDNYKMYDQFSEKTESLREMNIKLRNYNSTIKAMMREEELLSVKIRIHDELGRVLLATKRFINLDDEKVNEDDAYKILKMWNNIVDFIRMESQDESFESMEADLVEAASDMGIDINIYGNIPYGNDDLEKIFVSAAKECLTNVARHAGGDILNITIYERNNNIEFHFTNNGQPPESPIFEGGGLSNLRFGVEKIGGMMNVEHVPEFHLTLIIPSEYKGI